MEETNRPEIMRGHIDECLAHILQKLSLYGMRSPQKKEIITAIANFCGVTSDPASRWLRGSGVTPIGDQKIKLMCFLDLLGYRIIELENMTDSFRGLAEIIAFGLITGSAATKEIGYADPSTLYSILYGQSNTSSEKKEKIWQMVKERKLDLSQAKEKALKQLPAFAAALFADTSQTEPTTAVKDSELIGTSANTFSQGMLCLLQGINVLLVSEMSGSLTDQELIALPDSQAKIITELAAKLEALADKRKQLKGQTGGANGSG